MIVGVPRETKEGERRVSLLPEAVRDITAEGHDVRVETRAGRGVGFDDDAYREAGADIVVARDAWDSDLIVKVKEMQDADFAIMPSGAAIFSFHHLPGEPERTRALARSNCSKRERLLSLWRPMLSSPSALQSPIRATAARAIRPH